MLVPQPPAASVADFALAFARGVVAGGGVPNAAFTVTLVAPSDVVNPNGKVIAAALLTPKRSGFFLVLGSLLFTASAAVAEVTVSAVLNQGTALTVTGGSAANASGLRYETGTPVVIGGSGISQSPCGGGGVQVAAGSLINTLPFGCLIPFPGGAPAVISVGMTASDAATFSALAFSFAAIEL